uniref:Uncharacterized protein n=1 Tax=Anguilla anguilla TaxID=7936 RepID=A0A0E9U862_ANGAN
MLAVKPTLPLSVSLRVLWLSILATGCSYTLTHTPVTVSKV